MKQFYLVIVIVIITSTVFAQAPQKMSYQAVVRDTANILVTNTTVGMQISILQGSATGTSVFVETHAPTTNINGLATFEIGTGTIVTGNFSSISWENSPYFIKVETDLLGGTNYTISGTSELLSVPYSLYAENINTNNIPGFSSLASLKNGIMVVVYTNSTAYGFTLSSSGNPTWFSQGLSGTPIGGIATDSSIVLYTSTSIYGFALSNLGNPTWFSQGLSGTPIGILSIGNTFVVYTSSALYGFTRSSLGNPTYFSQGISGSVLGGSANGNVIVVYTTSTAYGFTRDNLGNPTWFSQGLSGTPLGIIPK